MPPACSRCLAALLLLSAAILPALADRAPRPPAGLPPKLDSLGDPLPPGARARLGSERFRHDALGVAFLGANKVVSVGTTICIWERSSGRMLGEFSPPKLRDAVNVAFSANGRVFVSVHASGQRTYRVWDATTGKLIHEAIPKSDSRAGNLHDDPNSVKLSGDGSRLATCEDSDHLIRLWDVGSNSEPAEVKFPPNFFASGFALSPDGQRVAAYIYCVDGDAKEPPRLALWDHKGHSEAQWDAAPSSAAKPMVAFSAESGAVALVTSRGSSLRTLDGKELWRSDEQRSPLNLIFSRGGHIVIFEPRGQTENPAFEFAVIDATNGKARCSWSCNLGELSCIAASPDGKTIAGVGRGRITLWNITDGKEIMPTLGHPNAICTTCITPDSRYLASTDFEDNDVRLWDTASGKEVRHFIGHTAGCVEIVFSPNGKLLASSSKDNTVRIWDVESGREIYKLADFSEPMWHLRFLADNRTLAVCPFRSVCVALYDCLTGKKIHEHSHGTRQTPNALIRHPDGRLLLVDSVHDSGDGSSANKTYQVWDVMTGRLIRRLPGHGRLVCAVLSPDGRSLATRGDDGTLRLWELASGQELLRIEEGEAVLTSGTQFFTFSPDGRTIASANRREPRVYLWDLTTGQRFANFEGHRRPMYTVEYSPDGRTLFTGSQDSTMLAWDMTTPAMRSRLIAAPLGESELAIHWEKLNSGSAEEAYHSLWALAGDPQRSVAFLRGRFQPPKLIAAEVVRGWIDDLESPKFAVREKADRALLAHFDQAEQALRVAFPKVESGEARKRIGRILENSVNAVPPPDRLRELRAIEVLEQIGTPQAREVLRELAAWPVWSRTAKDAAHSLERLR